LIKFVLNKENCPERENVTFVFEMLSNDITGMSAFTNSLKKKDGPWPGYMALYGKKCPTGMTEWNHFLSNVRKTEINQRLNVAEIFRRCDTDGNGTLSFKEYFTDRCAQNNKFESQKKMLKREFDLMDKDSNGELDFEEMTAFFMEGVKKRYAMATISSTGLLKLVGKGIKDGVNRTGHTAIKDALNRTGPLKPKSRTPLEIVSEDIVIKKKEISRLMKELAAL